MVSLGMGLLTAVSYLSRGDRIDGRISAPSLIDFLLASLAVGFTVLQLLLYRRGRHGLDV
jgi:hypothetical protein